MYNPIYGRLKRTWNQEAEMKRNFAFIAVILLLVAVSQVAAAQQEPQGTQEKATVSAGEQEFMINVAQDGMFEVKAGKLAEEKATNQKVKDFGARMVHDHSAANDQLRVLAEKKEVELPQELDQEHQKIYDEIASTPKENFDAKYMDTMVKGHEKAVSLFEKEKIEASDPELKAWVTQTLPTLQEHLKMARQVDAEIKGGEMK